MPLSLAYSRSHSKTKMENKAGGEDQKLSPSSSKKLKIDKGDVKTAAGVVTKSTSDLATTAPGESVGGSGSAAALGPILLESSGSSESLKEKKMDKAEDRLPAQRRSGDKKIKKKNAKKTKKTPEPEPEPEPKPEPEVGEARDGTANKGDAEKGGVDAEAAKSIKVMMDFDLNQYPPEWIPGSI